MQISFPPTKEDLNVPSQLIGHRDLLGRQIIAIHDAGLPRGENLVDKRPFICLAVREEELRRDRVVQVEAEMGLCLFGAFAVIGPVHRKGSVDQGAVYELEVSEFYMLFRKDVLGLFAKNTARSC